MRTILILFVCLLSGCATTKNMQGVILDNKTKDIVVLPKAEDLSYCEDLPEPKDNKAVTIAYEYGHAMPLYYECYRKHKELADWILRNHKQ